MRRARPTSWISGGVAAVGGGLGVLHPTRSTAASESGAADTTPGPSPREEELRAALGSDEVLANNVTLLMSRRQRGEVVEDDDEEGMELEDVVLDDEEAAPGSAEGTTEGAAAAPAQAGSGGGGGGAIAPLIHQVLRMPLMWREEQGQQQEQEAEDEEAGRGSSRTSNEEDATTPTPAAPTLGPAALALLLSAFLVRARREQQRQQRQQRQQGDRRVHPSSTTVPSESSSEGDDAAEAGQAGGAAVTSSHSGGVLGGVRGAMRGCWAPVSGVLRRNHLVVLYCFGAFVLVRMWFFAFARKDSKLISFCAFIMFLAAYIWWTRRIRAARMQAAQVAAAAAARQLGARRGGLFEGMDLRELQNIMMEARLHEDQRERGLSAEGKAALVHFSYRKPPPTPTTAATATTTEAAAGGAGFEGAAGEDEPEELAPTVSRQSSSCLSLAASTKQPSGVWLGEEGPCAASEGSGREGATTASGQSDDDEEDEEAMVGGWDGVKKGQYEHEQKEEEEPYPADALIDRQCSICLCEYEEGDSLTLLPVCRHTFHDACLSVWLARHVRCPLCQFDLSVLGSGSDPSPALLAATPMAPRRRGEARVYDVDDSDEDSDEEDEEAPRRPSHRARGDRRVMMTIVNEPAGRVGFGGDGSGGTHPVMRIVAVNVGEEGQ